ncbi:MAG: hypothetical protein FJ333_09360 [Sphingomonadales bacterium]|nr:hypothetical protein [Sphingomonadales bacterium]
MIIACFEVRLLLSENPLRLTSLKVLVALIGTRVPVFQVQVLTVNVETFEEARLVVHTLGWLPARSS